MARALRINYPGAFYHVTCRGNERKNIFGEIGWYMKMNLREAVHMCELRTMPQGHPDYRFICHER